MTDWAAMCQARVDEQRTLYEGSPRQQRAARLQAQRTAYRRDRVIRAGEHVDRLVVLERDDGICGICGEDVDPFNYHVDHIEPIGRGGEHNYANVQTAHPACNRSKGLRQVW